MQYATSEILAEQPESFSRRKSPWLKIAVSLIICCTVALATAGTLIVFKINDIPSNTVVDALPRPQTLVLNSDGGLPYIHDDTVQPGDTIHAIFRRFGIDDPEALGQLMNTSEGKQTIRQLRANRSMIAMVNGDGSLMMLSLPVSRARSDSGRIILERDENNLIRFRSTEEMPVYATTTEMRAGTIRHSLFGAADQVGLPDSIAMKLADLFGTKINFHTELRQGDHFSVIYEMVYEHGVPVRTGRILAAEFINRGKRHAVVLYKPEDRAEQYFTEEGTSLGQSFLRSPLEYSRMSSGFGKRIHPIYKTWRNHSGVDFAAPTGTPVKAASDGTVTFVGTQGGYGKIVVLKHQGVYSTAYAHLSRFAADLKKGMSVSQNDIIGYVGQTGAATGPHLHYEIRVKNVAHDPIKIDLPPPDPLSPEDLAKFKEVAEPLLNRMLALKRIPPVLKQAAAEKTEQLN